MWPQRDESLHYETSGFAGLVGKTHNRYTTKRRGLLVWLEKLIIATLRNVGIAEVIGENSLIDGLKSLFVAQPIDEKRFFPHKRVGDDTGMSSNFQSY
jgi:hypothetical protein